MNSLKYGLVLPALAAFMLLFQVKTVAQEKETSTITKETKVKIAVHINKDSKDDELKKQAQIFKNEFDADVDFQNMKRNDKSEITAVKVTVKDKANSQVYEVAGTEPIAPFSIEAEKDETGRKSFSFGTGSKQHFVKGRNMIVRGNRVKGDTLFTNKDMIIMDKSSMAEMPVPPTPPDFPKVQPFEGHWSVNSLKFGDTDALIVINGVKQKKGSEIKLPLNEEIAEFNILKDKEAKKKYGKEGKDGVVEIITRKTAGMRMGRLGHGGGNGYAITIPEGDLNFDFDMESFGDMDMMRLNGFDDFQKMFEDMDGNFNFSGDMNMSDEDMEIVMKRIKSAQDKLKNTIPQVKKELKQSRSEKEYKEALEEAKKGMEEARKEMEKARKDLEKTRQQLNKKI